MKGDLRINMTVQVVGEPEPIVAMESESDNPDATLRIARICLDQAEAKLNARLTAVRDA